MHIQCAFRLLFIRVPGFSVNYGLIAMTREVRTCACFRDRFCRICKGLFDVLNDPRSINKLNGECVFATARINDHCALHLIYKTCIRALNYESLSKLEIHVRENA